MHVASFICYGTKGPTGKHKLEKPVNAIHFFYKDYKPELRCPYLVTVVKEGDNSSKICAVFPKESEKECVMCWD
jgi:hypothetical protein